MNERFALLTPEDPLPGDARALLRVIAHEWLRDISYTIDNVERVIKFLEAALLNFDAQRAEHLRVLTEQVIEMNNMLIRPVTIPLTPEDSLCLGAPLNGGAGCSDLWTGDATRDQGPKEQPEFEEDPR